MIFFHNYQGEFYALLTALFWTITAVAFESASLKVGSLAVNIIRLLIAFVFLCFYTKISRDHFFPVDASMHNWLWLGISGFVGFVLGDLFLFKSYTLIGSRNSMLIMSLVPAMAAFFGWLMLHENLSLLSLIGMCITIIGIALAIFSRKQGTRKFSLNLSPKGLLFAFAGAVGQALGLVLSKFGMEGYDSFASNQIRILAGIIGFSFLVSYMKRWPKIITAFSHAGGMTGISIGSFFGPFLGVSFSLLSVAHTKTGIASTIMSLVPIFLIPFAILYFKQKVTLLEVVGAIISVAGVSIFFIV